jgi:drug/metabolite transporter (DMT)-like permease
VHFRAHFPASVSQFPPLIPSRPLSPTASIKTPLQSAFVALTPALFVVLWSTGFIGMKLGAPFAEPFTFMGWRMLLVLAILLVIIAVTRAPWPRNARTVGHIAIAGLLVHATYLCGVLFAIQMQLPLGFVALIAGLQPILTAVFANLFLHEKLNMRQWLGMALGLMGVLMVVMSKYSLGTSNWTALGAAGIGLLGITFGTLYQKRFCANMDLRTGGIIQYSATAILLWILAFATETRVVQWTGQFVFALFWLSIVLSIGAIGLLYLLIRRGAASKVASLFFLTPSMTAVMAFVLFGETLGLLAIAGLLVTATGVALVMRSAAR